ncbi:hypothetical protein SEA_MOAB_248 [Streptomyces phage Moab]|nr:hypothetical protein SEA_MOAB_248 [Streptomyces phage Moab]
MKPKYRRGTRYAYMMTFSYSPAPYPAGTMKIATCNGSFVLKRNATAIEMMNEVILQAKNACSLPEDTVIFPSFYHVEEQYQLVK